MADDSIRRYPPKFNRFCEIYVNGKPIGVGCRTRFDVDISVGGFETIGYMEIYNLSKSSRELISQPFNEIVLRAGYEGNNAVLFTGLMYNANSYRDEVDIITELWVRTGNYVNNKIVNVTMREPKDLEKTLSFLIKSTGFGIGEIKVPKTNFTGALTVSGTLQSVLNKLAKSFGLYWRAEGNLVYVYSQRGEGSSKRNYHFHAGSGLLDTPILTEMGYNCVVMLEPGIRPGDKFDITASGYNTSLNGLNASHRKTPDRVTDLSKGTKLGTQITLAVHHTGDTHDNSWQSEIRGIRPETYAARTK